VITAEAESQRHENMGTKELAVAMLKSPGPYWGVYTCHMYHNLTAN